MSSGSKEATMGRCREECGAGEKVQSGCLRAGRGPFISEQQMKSFAAATQALKRKLGSKVVVTDDASLHEASFDSVKIPFRPEAVVRVRKEAEIGVVLELANRHR